MSTATALPACPICEQPSEVSGDQACPHCQASAEGRDRVGAIDFVRQRLSELATEGLLTAGQLHILDDHYAQRRADLVAAVRAGRALEGEDTLPPRDRCWDCKEAVHSGQDYCTSCAAPLRSGKVRTLRYLRFLGGEIERHERKGRIPLRQSHSLQSEVRERIAFLKNKLEKERPPELQLVPEVKKTTVPRRPILEILLDPRSIQWLLAGGGALLVLGLVIYLVAVGFFENKAVVAVAMGLGTGALLFGGWAVIHFTRYQLAGRALTLLACLVMPLNLWFYDAHELITIQGNLWMAALVCCVLYAASAWVLRDELFVYVFAAGVAMTGLMILGTQDVDKFWEIARPTTMLVVLGLVCLGAERAFPEMEGPFGRKRFGMAFFRSGQALLGAGLLILLGAHLFGWMHEFFKQTLPLRGLLLIPPAIITEHELRLLSLALVLAGMAAYLYSDIVVRRVGFYIYLAIFNLLWAEAIIISLLEVDIALELVIVSLALTALAANLLQLLLTDKVETLSRSGPPLGLFLSSVPVFLGLLLHMRATNSYYHHLWPYTPNWGYVGAMLATAISCRIGAYIFRHSMPRLSGIYFLGTAAATLIGAAGLLAVLGVKDWTVQALYLMLIPIAYLVAARLYRGHTAEQPLIYVGHIATAVMALTVLVSVLDLARPFFEPITRDYVNLRVALFFAEAAIFYGLATVLRPQGYNVYLGAAMACAAVWQLLLFQETRPEYYTLAFSLIGFALLVTYRLALLERFNQGGLATAGFQSANVLLSLAFAATILLTLKDLAFDREPLRLLVFLLIVQTVLSLLSAWLVQHQDWRRWYVITAIVMGGLTFLVLYQLSELNVWQKLQIFSMVVGILLLAVGHIGWYREVERQQDMVSTSLFLGSILVVVPLVIAVGLYRTSTVTYFDAPKILRTTNQAIDPDARTLTMTIGDKEEKVHIPAEAQIFYKGKRTDLTDLAKRSKGTLVLVGLSDTNEVLAISVVSRFHFPNELGLFLVGLLLLASGILLQIKSTTILGGVALGLDLIGMALFIRIPEARQTVGLFLAIGGGALFTTGLILSIFRDRLLALPDKIKQRQGLFRVLNWR